MAAYRVDTTRNVEPAMANPATLAKAAEAKAGAAKTLAGLAGELYKGYTDYKISGYEREASELATEFFVKGKAAEAEIPKLEKALIERQTIFEKRDTAAASEFSPESQTAIQKQLSILDGEVTRLTNAVNAGMSNVQYQERINSLMRKAIVQMPGRADEIRDRVSALTGLPGAERWATMQYVRDRFTPPKEPKGGKTEEELALDDIKRMAPLGTFGSSEELFKLFKENKPEYDRRRNAANDIFNVKTTTDTIKARVEGTTIQTDENVKVVQGSLGAIFQGSLTTAVLAQDVKEKEGIFAKTIELMAAGDPRTVNAVQFETLVKLHAAQMRSNIDNAKREATDTARKIIDANPGMSDARKKSLLEDIDKYATEALTRYADDKGTGLVAMASILRNYRDKTVQERQQLLDLHIKLETATQNTPLVQQFRQGGEARKRLEREQPYFYQFMVKQENTIARLAQGLTAEIDGAANLADMRRVMLQAGEDPGPVPVDPLTDTDTTKAAHEMLYASTKRALGERAVNKTDLRPEEVTLVSATLSTGALYGANTRVLAKDYKKFSEQISKLSEPDQAIIKSNVSDSVSRAITQIQEIKSLIEDKYKVTLEIGVNSAGELGVVAPTKIPTPRYGTTPGSFTRVSSEYIAASKSFTEKLKPLLNNSVYSRAMLTNEQPSAISQEFATLINNRQPYNGFFSMEAMPVAPAVQSAGTPSSPEAAPVAPAPAATASKPAPAASAARPAASAPAAGVKATMADIAAYAASKKIKVSEAEKLLRAQGVIIED